MFLHPQNSVLLTTHCKIVLSIGNVILTSIPDFSGLSVAIFCQHIYEQYTKFLLFPVNK